MKGTCHCYDARDPRARVFGRLARISRLGNKTFTVQNYVRWATSPTPL